MAFRKIKAGLVNSNVEQFVGEIGNLFFDITDGTLRLSDGVTPGGNIVSGGSGGGDYTLPTASTTVKGGVKVDGTTITINNQIISATQQDLSSYATQTYVTTRGYLTSVGTISYNDLSNKPTIPSLTGYATETFVTTRGYLTSVGTISYTDLSNKPNIPTALSALSDVNITGTPDNGHVLKYNSALGHWAPAADLTGGGGGGLTLSDLDSAVDDTPSGSGNFTYNDATGVFTYTPPDLSGYATLTGEQTLTNKTLTSPTITDGVFQDTFSIGNQIFYEHGYNGFSVNEDFDIVGVGNFTGYHYTSGAGRDGVAFTLARTGQFTTGFGIHGTAQSNEYVIASETTNTDFVFKNNIGMPFDVSGGSEIFRIGSNGNLTFSDNTVQDTAWLGYLEQLTWTRLDAPSPSTLWRTAVDVVETGATITLFSGLPGLGSVFTWTFDEDKITFPDATTQTTAFTGSVDANSLTGTTLASGVTASSLTSLGTLSGLTVGGTGGDLTMTGGAITGVGNITAAGILAVNASGGITTTQTSFDIVNSTATTVNLGGAATTVNIGAITGTLTLNNPTVVGTQTTATLFNTVATTVSAFGAATTLTIGATSGTLTLRNTTIVGTQTSLTLFNTVASTVNTFGAATTLNIGNTATTASTTNINTAATATGTTKTINIATGSAVGSTTAVNIGSTLGTSTVTVNGSLVGTLTGNASTATKLATARAINGVDFDGSAAITVTAAAGTLSGGTLASGVLASSLTSVGTLTGLTSTGSITANNTTAFIAGDNAISNIALQMPREGAIRNLYNGSTNMYFDVSIGGTTQGQFQFRSSSGYTNVLTMSSTGVTFNTDATFTSRTPSLARTAFNSAIDTEITVDEMRFRISNQGGIFPQVIGNTSSRNLAWTGVGAISGGAITQVGSTGTIVASNAWTTLYNSRGMDSAGDTVTVTLQDKALSRIYRITFMRSDNGSTTGYNIIAERLL